MKEIERICLFIPTDAYVASQLAPDEGSRFTITERCYLVRVICTCRMLGCFTHLPRAAFHRTPDLRSIEAMKVL